MKIVHLDTGVINHHGDLSWERLNELGEFTHYPQTSGLDEFVAYAGDAHAVITMRSPVTREMIYSARDLEIICSGTVGFDHIDLEAANERGITVTHVPSSDIAASAVAQGTMALLLGLTNHAGYFSQRESIEEWRENRQWSNQGPSLDWQIYNLRGKTLGLVGFGGIGRSFAETAHASKMNIMAVTTSRKKGDVDPEHPYVEFCTLSELLPRADVVSLHCPYTPGNHHLINETTIGQMKNGVIILNTSRGNLVDEFALAKALHTRRVRSFGADVLSTEPPSPDNPLLKFGPPRFIITHHNSWTAPEIRQLYADSPPESLKAYLEGRPKNVVNNPIPRIGLVAHTG